MGTQILTASTLNIPLRISTERPGRIFPPEIGVRYTSLIRLQPSFLEHQSQSGQLNLQLYASSWTDWSGYVCRQRLGDFVVGLIWKLCALASTLGLFRLAFRYEHLSLYEVCVLHAADQYSVNIA